MVSVSQPDHSASDGGGQRSYRQGGQRDAPSFEALPDSLPPQNLEAEEAVLGGILLDQMPLAAWRMSFKPKPST